jgi:hypothetical protein
LTSQSQLGQLTGPGQLDWAWFGLEHGWVKPYWARGLTVTGPDLYSNRVGLWAGLNSVGPSLAQQYWAGPVTVGLDPVIWAGLGPVRLGWVHKVTGWPVGLNSNRAYQKRVNG